MDISGARKFFLSLMAGVMLFFSGNAWSQVITCITINVPDDYATIQAAIDAASSGDIINVDAGTYPEVLTISKQVSIVGAGVSQVTIEAGDLAGSNNAGIYVSADNVSLQGFTLDGGSGTPTHPLYGIKYYAVSGGSLTDILVVNVERTGFDLLGISATTVSSVSSQDNGGHGIQLSDCNNIALSNITATGNTWNGISICTWGNYTTLGTSGIVLTGTNVFDGPFQIEEGDYNTPGFPPAGEAIITYSITLDASRQCRCDFRCQRFCLCRARHSG